MPIIFVPYHQDEQLSEEVIPLPAKAEITVTRELPDSDIWHRLGELYDGVAEAVADEIRGGRVPAVVSGDCLVSLGVVAGVQRAGVDASVIWLDAHGDVHTRESSTSGYLGGMSLRLMLGAHPELVAERLGLRAVPERRAVLVDARDLDPAEVEYLASAEIRRCPVNAIEVPEGPLILHVDLDVIDCDELPGMLFPAANGPSSGTVLDAVRKILAGGNVVALDIACPWHPGRAEELRARLLAEILA